MFKWLWNALHGSPIVVEGGQQTRDLTYIDDVVQAWILGIEATAEDVAGQKFYVGYGEEHTIEELAAMCREITWSDVPIEYAGYRPGEEGTSGGVQQREGPPRAGLQPAVPAGAGHLPDRRVGGKNAFGIFVLN